MRGIINYVRGFISEAQKFGISAAMRERRQHMALALRGRYFSNHLGGSMSGIFISLPLARSSAWFEWRDVNCGLGVERSPGDTQVWLGRLHIVVSAEPGVGGNK